MKDLIVFYSLEGNTKQAAEKIANILNADILQLKTVKEIPKNNMKFFIGGMQAMFGICARIEAIDIDFGKYDRIILGTPVWANKAAPAVNTFLKNYNVKDKVTALFTCSGVGDNEKCVRHLKKKLNNLKASVALADRHSPISSENDKRLESFLEELTGGK